MRAMTTIDEGAGQPARKIRADAQHNEQALLAAAAVFVTSDVEAPVRDIAAGVGMGTISWEEICTLRGRCDILYWRGKSCNWFLSHGRAIIMVEPSIPLTAFSEDQRAQAHTRWTFIRPALEDRISQAQVVRTHHISKSTIAQWVKRFQNHRYMDITLAAFVIE
jgi:hypothetical protein